MYKAGASFRNRAVTQISTDVKGSQLGAFSDHLGLWAGKLQAWWKHDSSITAPSVTAFKRAAQTAALPILMLSPGIAMRSAKSPPKSSWGQINIASLYKEQL